MQNGYMERLYRFYREDVFDAYWFNEVHQLRNLTDKWIKDYNNKHPHASLGNKSPREYRPRFDEEFFIESDIINGPSVQNRFWRWRSRGFWRGHLWERYCFQITLHHHPFLENQNLSIKLKFGSFFQWGQNNLYIEKVYSLTRWPMTFIWLWLKIYSRIRGLLNAKNKLNLNLKNDIVNQGLNHVFP